MGKVVHNSLNIVGAVCSIIMFVVSFLSIDLESGSISFPEFPIDFIPIQVLMFIFVEFAFAFFFYTVAETLVRTVPFAHKEVYPDIPTLFKALQKLETSIDYVGMLDENSEFLKRRDEISKCRSIIKNTRQKLDQSAISATREIHARFITILLLTTVSGWQSGVLYFFLFGPVASDIWEIGFVVAGVFSLLVHGYAAYFRTDFPGLNSTIGILAHSVIAAPGFTSLFVACYLAATIAPQ